MRTAPSSHGTEYRHVLDLVELTVVAVDTRTDERFDLNAEGVPCVNHGDLREFVHELYEQGAFTTDVRDTLLARLTREDSV